MYMYWCLDRNAFESREHVAVDHIKESMQLLEAALAEKDQVIILLLITINEDFIV